MGGSSSTTTSSSNNQKELQDCQASMNRCTENNEAYAKDIKQYKDEQAKLKKENEDYKSKVDTLNRELTEAKSIINEYVTMDDKISKFCADFSQFKSKKETFASLSAEYVTMEDKISKFCADFSQFKSKKETFSSSADTSVDCTIAIILVVIGAAIVAYFLWMTKYPVSGTIDTKPPSDIIEP